MGAVADTLTIETDCVLADNWYIRGVTLNGKAIDQPFVTCEEPAAGGVLPYELEAEVFCFSSQIPLILTIL